MACYLVAKTRYSKSNSVAVATHTDSGTPAQSARCRPQLLPNWGSSFSRAYQVTCDYPKNAQSNPLPPNRAFWDSLPPKPGMWRSLQRDMIKAANQTGCQDSKALMFTLNKDTGANQALMFTSFNVKLIEAKDEAHAAASELPGFCSSQICTN